MTRPETRRRTRTGSRTRVCFRGLILTALALAACSDDTTGGPEAVQSASPSSTEAHAPTSASADHEARPSIVLIVVESLRTDALASYGADRSSPLPRGDRHPTPRLDALAEQGVRYAWAIASSPDSVTSHTSILTGLSPEEHGAGLWTTPRAAAELESLAETLSGAGYQTAGFSENPMIGPDFGLDQGFEHFESPDPAAYAARLAAGHGPSRDFGLLGRVQRWLERRDRERPYFLFVNLADPHLPYEFRENNPFLPPGTSTTRVDNVLALHPHNTRICRKLPDPESLEILAALYLHSVEAADRKLGNLIDLTRKDAPGTRPPITAVTADHGAHFGEQQLLGHAFVVDNRAIRVPLVIDSGEPRPAGTPSVIEAPVAQRRIADSIRCWAGLENHCARALPKAEPEFDEAVVSVAGNEIGLLPPAATMDTGSLAGKTLYANALCARDTGHRGRNVAYIKGQMKYVWRQHAPDQLFDLSWDPGEKTDQIERGGADGIALGKEVEAFIAAQRLDRVHRVAPTGTLRSRAEDAYSAGRRALFGGGKTNTDAVWFAQLVTRLRPDAELSAWIEEQIPLHEQDPFYPIISPKGVSAAELPDQLGRGVGRFTQFLLAAVAGPDDRAMRYLDEYLALDTSDYILTHQLTALEWARAMGRPLSAAADGRRPQLLAAIAQEHASDPEFSDLWTERAAFLVAFGKPSDEQVEEWTQQLVEHHLGNGDWGHSGSEIEFDGHSKLADHPREHVRGMAMIVLARYLAQTEESTPRR